MANNKENKELNKELNENNENMTVETSTEETAKQEEQKLSGKCKNVLRKIGHGAKKALPYVGAAVIGAVATFSGLAIAGKKAEDAASFADSPAIDDPSFDPTIPVDVE